MIELIYAGASYPLSDAYRDPSDLFAMFSSAVAEAAGQSRGPLLYRRHPIATLTVGLRDGSSLTLAVSPSTPIAVREVPGAAGPASQ